MAEIRARIILEDDLTSQIVKPIEALNKMKETANNVDKAIDSISSRKINVNASNAIDKIKNVKESMENITKKKFEVAINAIDKTKSVTSKVRTELNSLVKAPATIVLKAKDETIAAMSKIRENLLSLKTLAAGIVLGETGKATIGAASRLEQEQIAMKHFINYNNQKSSPADVQKMTDSYIAQLRTEANATPFSTNEIIAAGRRAVNITSGDTKQGMDLVKLSENMAALNPGKSVMDAMEALADAKTGEYERMKEFGFKITQNDVNKAGGTDQYFKTQFSSTGNVGKVFKGGADELSKTTAGNWSTVTGNLESIGANFGKAFLPVINKVLTPLASLLDKNSDKFTKFGQSIVNAGIKIGTSLTPAFTFLKNVANQYVLPAFTAVSNVIKKYAPGIISFFSQTFNSIKPYLKQFWNTIQTYIIPIIKDLWNKVKDILPGVGAIFKAAFEVATGAIKVAIDIFDAVAPGIKVMYDIISPILDGVIWLFDHVAGAIETAVGWLDKWNGKDTSSKANETATNLSKLGMPGMTSAGNLPGYKQPSSTSSNKSTDLWKYVTGHNALGTNYWQGGETWVGENGPEKLILPGGSKILSNRQSMNMMNQQNKLPNMSSSSLNSMSGMPSQATKWGQDIPEGMAKGIKNNTKSVTDATTFMATKIRELIHFSSPDKGPLSDFDSYSVDMLKTFGTGIKNSTKLVTDPTTDMSTGVQNIYSDLTTKSGTSATQAMQEFAKGIQDSEANILSIVSDLGNKIITQFKVTFGIASPSRVMRKLAGYIPQGVVLGLQDTDIGAFIKKWIGDVSSLAQNGMGDVMKMILQPMADSGDNKGIISMVYNLLHGGGINGAVGGNVAEWILAGMMQEGVPSSWLVPLEMIASRESGNPGTLGTGDPTLINGVGVGNEYATGLMQVLPSTFRSFFRTDEGILNPVMSVRAAIREINQSWGGNPYNIPGLMGGGGYRGYANGGIATQPSIFGEGQYAEAAIPLKKNSSRSQQLLDIADSYINGDKKDSKDSKRDVNIYIIVQGNMVGNEEIADEIGEHIIKKVRAEIDNI